MTDQRIWELAGLNIGYDRAVRPLEFARAIEREVIATRTQGADMTDAYVGAREDLEDWKRRALEAEELNRKFMRDAAPIEVPPPKCPTCGHKWHYGPCVNRHPSKEPKS